MRAACLALLLGAVSAHAQQAAEQPPNALADRVETLVAEARAAASPDSAVARADRAVALARRPGGGSRLGAALYARGRASLRADQPGTEQWFAQAADAARRAGDRLTYGRALVWQGTMAAFDDREHARALILRGVAAHDAGSGPEADRALLASLNMLAAFHITHGRAADAANAYRRVVRLARRLEDSSTAGFGLVFLGDLAVREGDYVSATRFYDDAEAEVVGVEEEWGLGVRAYVEAGRASVDADLGRVDEAARRVRAVLEDFDAQGLPYEGFRFQLGEIYRRAGRFDEAVAVYREGYDLMATASEPRYRHEMRVMEAAALYDAGRVEEARRALQPAADSLLAAPRQVKSEIVALLLVAREARESGRATEAIRLARRAAGLAEDAGQLELAHDAYGELSRAMEARGDDAGALTALRQVAVLSDSLNDQAQAREVGRIAAEAAFADERRAQAERRQRLVWGIGGLLGFGALAALGTALYLRAVRRQRAETEAARDALAEANGELAEANSELAETNGDLALANRLLADARETQAQTFHAIGHDIRTPLTLAAGPIADLARGLHGALPEPAGAAVASVQRSLGRIGPLLDDLLDAARLDAGQMPHRPTSGDLAETTRETARAFAEAAERDGVTLDVQAPDALPARFDGVAIGRALGNVVANALRHTPAGGTVAVALAAAGGEARITVSDTGSGVAPEHRDRLFDRFYRADEDGTGTGLGLALAQDWLARHGGRVEVESQPGHGATFTLALPLVPAETGDGAATAVPELGDAPGDDALVVLVAEDNAEVRAYVAAHLARAGGAGFSEPTVIIEAADGDVAFQTAIEIIPDLVVSDVMMPRRDGVALTRALKEDARTSHIPVLLLTARADAQGRVAGFEAGADGYLPKPFDPEALRAQAAALVAERHRLRDAFARLAGTGDRLATTASGVQGDGAQGDGQTAVPGPPIPTLAPLDRAFVDRVDARIAERLADGAFGATQLAGDLDLSERQLRRKLKALTGETPGARLRRRRIETGAALLADGTHTVKEAAAATGYADAEGFRRAFVSVRGHQPSQATGYARLGTEAG